MASLNLDCKQKRLTGPRNRWLSKVDTDRYRPIILNTTPWNRGKTRAVIGGSQEVKYRCVSVLQSLRNSRK